MFSVLATQSRNICHALHRADRLVHFPWIEDAARPFRLELTHFVMGAIEGAKIVASQIACTLRPCQVILQPVIECASVLTDHPVAIPVVPIVIAIPVLE